MNKVIVLKTNRKSDHRVQTDAVSVFQQFAAEAIEAEHDGSLARLSNALQGVIAMLTAMGCSTSEINVHPMCRVVVAQITRITDVAMMVNSDSSRKWCSRVVNSREFAQSEFERARR